MLIEGIQEGALSNSTEDRKDQAYKLLRRASKEIKTASVGKTMIITASVSWKLDKLGDNELLSGNRAELDCMALIRMRQLKVASKQSHEPERLAEILERTMHDLGEVLRDKI